MRKFLLILACAFSFCVRAQTNIVELTQEQWDTIRQFCSLITANNWGYSYMENIPGGSLSWDEGLTDFQDFMLVNQLNLQTLVELLHLFFTGTIRDSYDSSTNNILAYASSLRQHNADVHEMLSSIDFFIDQLYVTVHGFNSHFLRQYDITRAFHSDYTNNFERLYDAITNLDFKVSISNQIDILQSMTSNLGSISNSIAYLAYNVYDLGSQLFPLLGDTHSELMDFLYSLSNSVLFASNLCNCCGGSNSNYQDSVLAMLEWMTNSFPDVAESPIGGGGGSNSVWHVWRPSESLAGGWDSLLVPSIEWTKEGNDNNYIPQYGTNHYDKGYQTLWSKYNELLHEYYANGKNGQEFLAGLVDLQLHILANISTQLFMIDDNMPTKTNLWDWIEQYKDKVSQEVATAESENDEAVYTASSLLDYSPFSIVGSHFPKVSSALNSLKLEDNASPVISIPIPRIFRVSDSDELIVDIRNTEWYTSGRDWCRWVFSFIWGWLFIRLGLVPIFYVFFFTVRVAEISAHLVFMGSIRGSSGIVSSFGAAAVDMVLSLIGIDTDFKKFVWGIMRD